MKDDESGGNNFRTPFTDIGLKFNHHHSPRTLINERGKRARGEGKGESDLNDIWTAGERKGESDKGMGELGT